MRYVERMSKIKELNAAMHNCEDVEETLRMFEEVMEHIRQCELALAQAQGRYSEIMGAPAETPRVSA